MTYTLRRFHQKVIPMHHEKPLQLERETLRHLIERFMREVTDLDTLAKVLPRIVSVSANVHRIAASLEAASQPDHVTRLMDALEDVEAEEEATW